MIKQVRIIEDFNTTIGHIIVVEGDQVFRIGQIIEDGRVRFRINGIQPHHDPGQNKVALRVENIT